MAEDGKLLLTLVAASATKLLMGEWVRWRNKSKFVRVGTVSQLNCYPIKSCQPLCVEQAACLPEGLQVEGIIDRTWMFTRPDGAFLSQRQYPQMALVKTSVQGDYLHIDAPNMPTLKVPKDPEVVKKNIINCRVFDSRLQGMIYSAEADQWVSQFLGDEGLHLVYSAPSMEKKDCSEYDLVLFDNIARTGDLCAFSDLTPYLIVNEKSLEDLNTRLKRPVSLKNFRPNIVIKDTSEAYTEDTWAEVKIGDSQYMRCLHPCPRCHLPTVDPETGKRDKDREPFVTLQKYRCLPNGQNDPFFGINAAADFPGQIKVGDPVYALKRRKSDMFFK